MRKIAYFAVGIAMTGLLATATLASGQTEMTSPIKARQEAMKTIKEHFVPLVKMVKGAAPFDAATVKKNAEVIARKLEEASKLFPEGSDTGKTRARPEIWLLEDEFQALFKTAIGKAKALARVNEASQLAPAVMELGGKGCKACHEKFRTAKDKKM